MIKFSFILTNRKSRKHRRVLDTTILLWEDDWHKRKGDSASNFARVAKVAMVRSIAPYLLKMIK
jgi:hypothetical protein